MHASLFLWGMRIVSGLLVVMAGETRASVVLVARMSSVKLV